jgi:hypothetical protein
MQEQLAAVFRKFLSKHRPCDGIAPDYGISVDDVSPDRHTVVLTLTFKAAARYCCAEPGCHLGLFQFRAWQRLRGFLKEADLEIPSPLTIHVRGIVEEGARLASMKKLGLPEEQQAYQYEDEYLEPVA